MPSAASRTFGAVDYVSGEEFIFAQGLPGFPREAAFLPIEIPEQLPLVYLQSLRTPDLCFVALPARCLVTDYVLSPNSEDLESIGLSVESQPGPEMLCLALVCFAEDGTVTANLRAPLVINIKNRHGIQIVQQEGRYPIRYPVQAETEAPMC